MSTVPARPATTDPATTDPATPRRTASRQPKWVTVMVREIMVRFTDKSFWIGTVASLLLIILAVGASILLGAQGQTMKVAVSNDAAAALATTTGQIAQARDQARTVELVRVADATEGEARVAAGDADLYLQENPAGGWTLVAKTEVSLLFMSTAGEALYQQALAETAAKAGVSLQDLSARMTITPRTLEGDQTRASIAIWIGIAFAALFLMASMTYGMQIATSVIEEKQSRIIEILVSVVPVRQVLTGKVLGNTVMALAQMVVMAGVGLIGLNFSPMKEFAPTLTGAVGWYVVFFLAGFLALACIWAAAGALGTRNEDLQQTSQPLVWVLILAYLAGFMATGTWRVALSYVPIVSSILMPVRLFEGTAQWWEVAISLLITLVFAAGMVLVGERIYRRALLQTQGRLTFRQALSLTDQP